MRAITLLLLAAFALPAQAYELCSAAQNADAFASNPVPVQEDSCDRYQAFESTSPNTGYTGGSCGGYTVVLGPAGDLKRNYKRFSLQGHYADAPLTQSQCQYARLQGVAWGYRCSNAACSSGAWQRIGNAADQRGTWNATSQVCRLSVSFAHPEADFSTLNIDLIATLMPPGQPVVKKRVRGSIRAERGNGKCFSATQSPSPYTAGPGPTIASQAGASVRRP